jgi:hypothetical protein
MAALRSSDITKEIVKPIAEFWWTVWKLITEAPKYAPILPGGMSMEWLKWAGTSVDSAIRTKYWAWSEASKKLSDGISNQFWFTQKDEYLKKMNDNYKLKDKIPVNWQDDAKTILADLVKWLDLSNIQHKKEFVDIMNSKFDSKLKVEEFSKLNNAQDVINYLQNNKDWEILKNIQKNDIKDIINGNIWKTTTWRTAAEASSSPKWISKNDEWINVTIHNKNEVLKLDHWKLTDWDIDKLVKWFETESWNYSKNNFKELLNELWLTDTKQIEDIWKKFETLPTKK